jgi:ribonuclease-3 family protein
MAVVSDVKADAQAHALIELEPYLSDVEKDFVRRGRNKAGRGPRNGDAAIYAKATGFETMIGWLFLKNPQRLARLLDRLEETESDVQ